MEDAGCTRHGYALSILARSKEAHRDMKVAEHNGNFDENVTWEDVEYRK